MRVCDSEYTRFGLRSGREGGREGGPEYYMKRAKGRQGKARGQRGHRMSARPGEGGGLRQENPCSLLLPPLLSSPSPDREVGRLLRVGGAMDSGQDADSAGLLRQNERREGQPVRRSAGRSSARSDRQTRLSLFWPNCSFQVSKERREAN